LLCRIFKVCIICPEHGEFWQHPFSHFNGFGCSKCSGCYQYSTKDFITKARVTHGDEYDYLKTEYKNAKKKVCIICPEHGEFWQTPHVHLRGSGCPECAKIKRRETREKKKIELTLFDVI
jgi:hypothetical protein